MKVIKRFAWLQPKGDNKTVWSFALTRFNFFITFLGLKPCKPLYHLPWAEAMQTFLLPSLG
jgi:hypothetical protein